ncbi:hypothetical protein D9611_001992 [Ephemerocybe angulata]|uniref:Uncharacterized protein n=1 Tax=Ephemerocybe angulata TaxID=980116 RepID=A0A8H5CIL7_9AGAR|nr:hypothetical protein D9611_001992 [Tulosesus angulatus]
MKITDMVQTRRQDIFKRVNLRDQNLNLILDAHVDSMRPLRIDNYAFVFVQFRYMSHAVIVTMYSNSAGKSKRHDAKTDTTAITGLSYLGIQLYERTFRGATFSAVHEETAALRTYRFEMISHFNFMLRIPRNWVKRVEVDENIELIPEAASCFDSLVMDEESLKSAMVLFTKRRQPDTDDEM